jgi:hypothetical protein
MSGYKVINREQIEKHISFIRIEPIDLKLTLGEILSSLSDLAWISNFDQEYIMSSFQVRAKATIQYISDNIINKDDTEITTDSGELVVSELSRLAIVNEYSYLDIPLAELIKIKDIGNHGFDFYSKNTSNILLFGEAKFNSSQTAYGKAFEQINRFQKIQQDISDIVDIDRFCCEESKENHHNGHKGFVAAFASQATSTERIINGIKRNADYKELTKFNELICVAVNV